MKVGLIKNVKINSSILINYSAIKLKLTKYLCLFTYIKFSDVFDINTVIAIKFHLFPEILSV